MGAGQQLAGPESEGQFLKGSMRLQLPNEVANNFPLVAHSCEHNSLDGTRLVREHCPILDYLVFAIWCARQGLSLFSSKWHPESRQAAWLRRQPNGALAISTLRLRALS